MHRLAFALGASALAALPLACTLFGGADAGKDASGSVVAQVEGEPITMDELETYMKDELYERMLSGKGPGEIYTEKRRALDRMIARRLLEDAAEEAGLDTNEYVQQQTDASVSDEEVTAFFEANRERMPEDATFESIAPQIRTHLQGQKRIQAGRELVSRLRDEASVEVALEAPRYEVAAVGPSRGPAGAPVTIVEFSDYQCPYCKRAEPVVQQILERYPEQVRVVHRHLPLENIHPQAREAAEAAVCAEEQGRFWEYHALLFESAPNLGPDQLSSTADAVGLDAKAFEACLASEDARERVQADVDAARELGIGGTPAFLVNGVLLEGAQPLEAFVGVIEDELRQSGETSEAPESEAPSGAPS